MLKSEMETKKQCNYTDKEVVIKVLSKNVGLCNVADCPRYRDGKGLVFIYDDIPLIKTCLPRP